MGALPKILVAFRSSIANYIYSTARHHHEALDDGDEEEDEVNNAGARPGKPSGGSGLASSPRVKRSKRSTFTSIQAAAAFTPTNATTPMVAPIPTAAPISTAPPISTVAPVQGRTASKASAYTTPTALDPALKSAKGRKRRAEGDLPRPEKPQSDRSPSFIKKESQEAQYEADGVVITSSRSLKQRMQEPGQAAQQSPTAQQPPAAQQSPTAHRPVAQPSISEEYKNMIVKLIKMSHAADESPRGYHIMYEEMPDAVKRDDRPGLLKLYAGLMSQLTLDRH